VKAEAVGVEAEAVKDKVAWVEVEAVTTLPLPNQ
jgi:hypothetical protein